MDGETTFERYVAHPNEKDARQLGALVVELVPHALLDPPPPDELLPELLPEHLIDHLAGYYGEKLRRAEAFIAERRLQRGRIQ